MPLANDLVHVAVFARAPVAGATKTRLIPSIGAAAAARLHRRFILQTLETATEAKVGPVTLWCAPDMSHGFFKALRLKGLTCREQCEGDLGSRMRNALNANPGPTLLVGTDCPSLTPEHFRAAAGILREGCDAVFLPAEDGGYALIGLSVPASPLLFDAVPWGTSEVMATTRMRLAMLGYSWQEPDVVWDVDTYEDFVRWKASLAFADGDELSAADRATP